MFRDGIEEKNGSRTNGGYKKIGLAAVISRFLSYARYNTIGGVNMSVDFLKVSVIKSPSPRCLTYPLI